MVCETPCRTKGRTVQAQPEKNEHGTCFPFDVVNSKGNNPQIHAMQTPIFLCFFVVSQYPEKYPIRCQVSFQVPVGHEGPWYNNPHSTDSTHKCPRGPFVTSKAVDVQIHATSFCWCHLLTCASRCYVSLFWGKLVVHETPWRTKGSTVQTQPLKLCPHGTLLYTFWSWKNDCQIHVNLYRFLFSAWSCPSFSWHNILSGSM
jgi:hypothetical protein